MAWKTRVNSSDLKRQQTRAKLTLPDLARCSRSGGANPSRERQGRGRQGASQVMARADTTWQQGSGRAPASVRAQGGDREGGRAGRWQQLGRRTRIWRGQPEQCPPMAPSETNQPGRHARPAMGCSRDGGKVRGQRHMPQRGGTGLVRPGGSSAARRRRARHARARQRGVEGVVTATKSLTDQTKTEHAFLSAPNASCVSVEVQTTTLA
jgi:hypothetical protein